MQENNINTSNIIINTELPQINIEKYEDEFNQNSFSTIQYVQGYIYIENVFVPANFSIQYKKNLFFRNIDGAILNANIQPPLYDSPNEKLKYSFENLLEILYYNPIVLATEKIISEKITKYTDKEAIKFIGIVDSASIKISYVNAASVINFLAVDLLNYALKVSNLYLFGNNLNLGFYNNALISTPSAFFQSIFFQALQSNKISLAFKNLLYPILMYQIRPVKIENITNINENENKIKNFNKEFSKPSIFENIITQGDILKPSEKITTTQYIHKNCEKAISEYINQKREKIFIKDIINFLECLKENLNSINKAKQENKLCETIEQKLKEAEEELKELEQFALEKNVLNDEIDKILKKLLFEQYNGENGFYVLSDFGKKLLYNPKEATQILAEIIKDIIEYKKAGKKIYRTISTGNCAHLNTYNKNYNTIKGHLLNFLNEDQYLKNAYYKFKEKMGENFDDDDVVDLLAKIFTKETGGLFASNTQIKPNNVYNTSGVWGISQRKLSELTDEEIDYIDKIYENKDLKKKLIYFKNYCQGVDFHLTQSKEMANYNKLDVNDTAYVKRLDKCRKKGISKCEECLNLELEIAKMLFEEDKGGEKGLIKRRKFALYTALKTLEGKRDTLEKFNNTKLRGFCAKTIEQINPDLIIKKKVETENNKSNQYHYYFNYEKYKISDANTKKKILMLFYNGCHPQALVVGYPQFNDTIEACKEANKQQNIFQQANYIQAKTLENQNILTEAQQEENIDEFDLSILQNITEEDIKEAISKKIKLFMNVEDVKSNIDYFKEEEIENLNPNVYGNFFEIPFSKMTNLRRFILSSIIMPKYFSNWSLLANAVISNLANLKINENNLHNLGQLLSIFLNMLNLRLTILTNPVYITENEDSNLVNRIIIYALIPDLEIPPIPNKNNIILDIIPINNRITQKNIATNIGINIISPATTLAILMPIMGAPTLIVFPLEKIKKYATDNTFITATNFVGKWSKLEFIRIPTIEFVQSPEENFILNAIKSHQVLPDNNNFSLTQLMFLAYMKYCFHFWRQFAYKELSFSNIPANYPFFISFPFYVSIPGGGSYIGILEALLKEYTVGGISYSFGLKNTYNIISFKNVISTIDREFKNDGIFRDFRFGVNDYYYLKSVIDLISFDNTKAFYLTLDIVRNEKNVIKAWYNIRSFIHKKLREIYDQSIEIALTYFKQEKGTSNIDMQFNILDENSLEKIYNFYSNLVASYEYGLGNFDEKNLAEELNTILKELIANGRFNFYTFKEDVERKYQ